MAVLSRTTFQPSRSSVSHIRSTTSPRLRASSEEPSPHAYETKISGVPLGGSSDRAVICSWLRLSVLSPISATCDEETASSLGGFWTRRGTTTPEDETNPRTGNLLVCSILGA